MTAQVATLVPSPVPANPIEGLPGRRKRPAPTGAGESASVGGSESGVARCPTARFAPSIVPSGWSTWVPIPLVRLARRSADRHLSATYQYMNNPPKPAGPGRYRSNFRFKCLRVGREKTLVDQIRIKGGVLLGALVSGALAAGTLTGAPTANATCASFFGIGNGADCSSTRSASLSPSAPAPRRMRMGCSALPSRSAIGLNASTANPFTFATAVGDRRRRDAEGAFRNRHGSRRLVGYYLCGIGSLRSATSAINIAFSFHAPAEPSAREQPG